MTNTNIQGPIPIVGPGFKLRNNRGGWKNGEFRQLINAEIRDDIICRRRNIRVLQSYATNTPLAFKGVQQSNYSLMGSYMVYNKYSGQKQIAFSPIGFTSYQGTEVDMYNFINPVTADAVNEGLLSVFNYNNQNYWLSAEQVGYKVNFVLRVQAELPSDPAAYTARAGYDAKIILFSIDPNTAGDSSNVVFNNSFMFKERLWVCTSDTLWFSKATDPTVFAVPDGGFFRFPDDHVNYAVAVKDTIYVICESKIYALTYDEDPNEDATQRVISSDVGGDHAVIFRDIPYFSNGQGIFGIQNNFIEKIVDASQYGSHMVELTVFGEYLCLLKISHNQNMMNTLGVQRINRWRGGYIQTFTAIGNYITNAVQTTMSLDNAAGAVTGSGLSSTSAIKAAANVAIQTIDWKNLAIQAADPNGLEPQVRVKPNTSYTHSVWLKTNCPDACTVSVTAQVYDATGTLLGSPVMTLSASLTNGLTSANGWKKFYWSLSIPNWPTASRIQIIYSVNNPSIFTNTEYVYSQLYIMQENGVGDTNLFYNNTMDSYVTDLWYENPGNNFGSEVYYYTPALPAASVSPTKTYSGGVNKDFNVQLWMLNMDNGSMHGITMPNKALSYTGGYIYDLHYEPDDIRFGPCLYINYWDDTSDTMLLYYMPLDRDYDPYVFDAYGATYTIPNIVIEIADFAPDGPEYMMKRFRNLELLGIMPRENMQIQFALDNGAYGAAIPLADLASIIANANSRPHFPRKIGINARGRTISMLFSVSNMVANDPYPGHPGDSPQGQVWGEFEISDMRLLYGYTGRGPNYKQLSNTP